MARVPYIVLGTPGSVRHWLLCLVKSHEGVGSWLSRCCHQVALAKAVFSDSVTKINVIYA